MPWSLGRIQLEWLLNIVSKWHGEKYQKWPGGVYMHAMRVIAFFQTLKD